MVLVSQCRLCSQALESTDYVLISYPYAKALWTALQNLFQVHFSISDSTLELYSVAYKFPFSSQIFVLWRMGVISIFWLLCFARNQATFNNIFVPINVSLCNLCKCIKKSSVFKVGKMHNTQSDLLILHRLRIP